LSCKGFFPAHHNELLDDSMHEIRIGSRVHNRTDIATSISHYALCERGDLTSGSGCL
jgi:hypothetical protein